MICGIIFHSIRNYTISFSKTILWGFLTASIYFMRAIIFSYLFERMFALFFSFDFNLAAEDHEKQENTRTKREATPVRTRAHSPVTTWGDMTGEGGVCVTSKAAYGKCMAFKNCYPYIKKIPTLSIFDTWVLGTYDTCTYLTSDGRQAFGVCCDDITKPGSIVNLSDDDNTVVFANKGTYANNWPPPIPTHPPNHTPATHPTRPINNIPTRPVYTTTKRPSWPPSIPTLPSQISTVGSTVADGPVGNYCGAKNGRDSNPSDQERIVGGQNASPNEWPWIVVLFLGG